jgi:branched-chain amino acid transport system ATP-binding protein
LAHDALLMSDVDAYYGDSHVLHRISLKLGEGRLLGLLGRNGAGKSTCMSVVVGWVPARRGRITINGVQAAGRSPEAIAALGVALVPQGRRVFRSLTVLENLAVAARKPRGGGAARWTIDHVWEHFPRLRERREQYAGYLSGGEQQMLAIGRALMARPKVLLLDEPSMGLAPMVISQIFRIISEINSTGTTVLLVEQNAQQALTRSDRAYILETGQVTRSGVARDLLADDSIRAAYLGVA